MYLLYIEERTDNNKLDNRENLEMLGLPPRILNHPKSNALTPDWWKGHNGHYITANITSSYTYINIQL